MRKPPNKRVKVHSSYGRYINYLSDGHNIVLIRDVPAALNLKKFIKSDIGGNLVIEPLRHNLWGLTWRGGKPKLVGKSNNHMYFDFGAISDWP